MQQEKSNVFYIPLDQISENPYQVRQDIPHDHIGNLASDIRMNGLLQNPAGRPVDADGNLIEYSEGCQIQLAYGHNRHQAYYLLDGVYSGYDKLPVKIVSYSDEEMALAAWSENESRKQLNPVDRAMTFQKWTDKFGWTQQQIAEKVRLERSTVANLLRLLSLPAEVLGLVAGGTISQRQATALIPFYDELSPSEQDDACTRSDFTTFMFHVLKGEVNSDTIRERISEIIADIHPAPPQFNFTAPAETPETGEVNTGSLSDAGQENTLTAEPGIEQAWLQTDIEGNDVPPEPVQIVEEPIVVAPAPVIPANQPALPVTPQNMTAELMANNPPPVPSTMQTVVRNPLPSPEPDSQPPTPKTWAESQYTVTLGFQAEDGNELGRQIFVSTRRNEEPPKFVVTREGAWNWNIPWQLKKLLDDLHMEDFQVEA